MDTSLAKALAWDTVEMERQASARPHTIRRLRPLRGQGAAQSVLELRFQSVENMIQAMDSVIGRGLRKASRRR
ncbi:MAG TPA: hypothetical protein VF789_07575 [Thermoanaerobaculia bacterium]